MAVRKFGLATGKIYRGITIYSNDEGICIIYGADNTPYEFVGEEAAREYIDKWYAAQMAIVHQQPSY